MAWQPGIQLSLALNAEMDSGFRPRCGRPRNDECCELFGLRGGSGDAVKGVSRIVLVVVVGGLLSACGTRTVLKPNPQPATSYRQLQAPKGAARYTLKAGETAVQPIPQKTVAPVYPPSLVHPGAAPVTVVAQLVMDEGGRVEGVFPVSNTDQGPDRALFEAAVRQAVVQWTFTPLWIQQPRSDGSYRLMRKPFSLWYSFQFKVVDGKPIVETLKR